MQLYMSLNIRSFFGFTFLNILYFFSSTLVPTSSIAVVFILSILRYGNAHLITVYTYGHNTECFLSVASKVTAKAKWR